MLEELQWKQGTMNITTNNTFNDYKYVEHHQPTTKFWKQYKINLKLPERFKDKDMEMYEFIFPLERDITCKKCKKHGTWDIYNHEKVCISGCFKCVKENIWVWGDVINENKKLLHIVCNGSYKGKEFTDLDHLYNSQNHELYLTNKRIFELGNQLIQYFKNDIIKNDEEKIVTYFHNIPKRIVCKYIFPLWYYIIINYLTLES